MSLRYQLLKDKQIMGGNYPKFDFPFYERSFTLITLRMERHRRHEWDLKWGRKGPTSPVGRGKTDRFHGSRIKGKTQEVGKCTRGRKLGWGEDSNSSSICLLRTCFGHRQILSLICMHMNMGTWAMHTTTPHPSSGFSLQTLKPTEAPDLDSF